MKLEAVVSQPHYVVLSRDTKESISYNELEESSFDEGGGPFPGHQQYLCNAIHTAAQSVAVMSTYQ